MAKSLIGIDAKTSDQIKVILLSVKAAPKNIQQNIKKYAKADIIPAWQQELAAQPADDLQKRLLVDTGRAGVTNLNVFLKAGGINAKVSGGLSTDTGDNSYRAAEFGANRFLTHKVKTSDGRISRKQRHTQRQFESTDHKGYVVYPAARKVIPRVAALWTQTIIRTLHDAVEGKLQ